MVDGQTYRPILAFDSGAATGPITDTTGGQVSLSPQRSLPVGRWVGTSGGATSSTGEHVLPQSVEPCHSGRWVGASGGATSSTGTADTKSLLKHRCDIETAGPEAAKASVAATQHGTHPDGLNENRTQADEDMTEFLVRQTRSLHATLEVRRRLLDLHRTTTVDAVTDALARFGLELPPVPPLQRVIAGQIVHQIDTGQQHVYSEFLRRSRMKLSSFVQLIRGETQHDSRPNKALEMPSHLPGWNSYPHRHLWEDIVRHGVRPSWQHPFPKQDAPPKNHASAVGALNAIVKSIRKGQAAGQYLVLDIDMLNLLEGITCSPFGAVQKGDSLLTTEARMIHDLSYPANSSVNDNTVDDASVEVTYDGPQTIAHRIMKVEAEFPGKAKMMSGDVAGAFRHIPIHADHVGRFAGTIQELGVLIVDLACPFGWTQSPMQYWIAGAAISHLYASTAPQWPLQPSAVSGKFVTKTWCDDHNCIEADIGSRTDEANLSLRRAMIAVLGPDSINEEKFTPWAQRGKALGLLWDIPASSLAMPPTKIAKAIDRINGVLAATSTSKTRLNQLLGSLRHVVTCVRAAAPFFQQLASLCRSARRTSSIRISPAARDDLIWFRLILQFAGLNAIPFTRFTQTQPVEFEVFMDASDAGLCAIFPAHQQFLQVRFDEDEQRRIAEFKRTGAGDYGINLRELMSTIFASLVWGHIWAGISSRHPHHVRYWIDNVAAVSWSNRRSSRNPEAQLILRLLSLLEVQHNFFSTSAHIAGVDNTMADAGSRVWQSPQLALTFANLSSGWTQVKVPPASRNLSRLWARFCALGPSQTLHGLITADRGFNGPPGAAGWSTPNGSPR